MRATDVSAAKTMEVLVPLFVFIDGKREVLRIFGVTTKQVNAPASKTKPMLQINKAIVRPQFQRCELRSEPQPQGVNHKDIFISTIAKNT